MFTASADFHKSILEVKLLTQLAEDNEKNEDLYSLFIRSSILFLGTIIECFLEEICEEYIFEIQKLKIKSSALPEKIRLSAISTHFNEELLGKIRNKKSNCIASLHSIYPLIDDNSIPDQIRIDTRFSYGKHGSAEAEALFSRIGYDNLFEQCKIEITTESFLGETTEIKNAKDEFNTLTSTRNKIIHENKTPSLTHDGVLKKIHIFSSLIDKISSCLEEELKKLSLQASRPSG